MRAQNCECAWRQSIFFLCQVVFVRRKRIHIGTKVQSVRFAGSQYIKSPSSIQARIGERLTMKANILVKKVLLDTQQHSFSNRVRRSPFFFFFFFRPEAAMWQEAKVVVASEICFMKGGFELLETFDK